MTTYDNWKTRDRSFEEYIPADEELDRLAARIYQLETLLEILHDYFDNRADISNTNDEDGSPRPNKEMQLLQEIDAVLK